MEPSDLIMFYDTETTGLWDFKGNMYDNHQPNLIQLGYKVYNRKREVIFEVGHLVNTTSFESWRGIEEGAFNAHHIPEENVRRYGNRPEWTMQVFMEWAERCNMFVAHNDDYDDRIMKCFAKRAGFNPDVFATGSKYCTMKNLTNVCKVPNVGRGGYKWPKLIEAYMFFFGVPFADAHNALADVNAAADIFWKMVDKELIRV